MLAQNKIMAVDRDFDQVKKLEIFYYFVYDDSLVFCLRSQML